MLLRSALLRSRHLHLRRLFSSTSTTTAAATTSSVDEAFSSAATPPSKLSIVLKAGLFSAVAAAIGSASYATYAYTADEVDEKTKAFRSSINNSVPGTMSTIEKLRPLLYSAIMTVPAKAIDLYLDVRRSVEERVQEIAEPTSDKLLPDMDPAYQQMGVLTLVLDLRGTLIYNEWKRETGWSTFKRPGLDAFLEHLSQIYEIVVYTDEMYVDHIMEKLVPKGVHFYLSRPATKYQDGKHFRDLSKLNRNPSKVLYVSGHALETCLQPENCVSIKPWSKEADDTTLIDLIPFLEFVGISRPEDVRRTLEFYQGKDIASEFIRRSKEHQRAIQQKKQQGPRWRRNWSNNNTQ